MRKEMTRSLHSCFVIANHARSQRGQPADGAALTVGGRESRFREKVQQPHRQPPPNPT